MNLSPAIVIHGGAWAIPGEELGPHKREMRKALQLGWEQLQKGASALDVVEKVTNSMEECGVFDASKGSILNEKGEVEMDAIVMSGDLRAGAVAALRCFPQPVSVARRIMEKTKHILLVGEGAAEFAEKEGFKKLPMKDFITERELNKWKNPPNYEEFGTVGAVVLDKNGKMASATSTGGTRGKMAGRVGDSPLIGCGGYCDNETGGASATGHGESFMKIVACKYACDLLKTEKSAQSAAEKTIALLKSRVNGKGGVILMRNDGDIGIAFNTPQMARGYAKDGKIEVFV